ncbi:hypothetical protein J7355_16165 [Endozoicomonas sp. G2_2]|uniref:hypothetical protein n=1 Tax=Endozoicomonas sp. G2_2 TaxID=2821092 RepID=UPI001ADB49EA|nr:hypothetical protein [Endozoicomonas sp. G2_2]MBO9471625.1 hypothetical protein [Endozoicomonas sp. G2_2]
MTHSIKINARSVAINSLVRSTGGSGAKAIALLHFDSGGSGMTAMAGVSQLIGA